MSIMASRITTNSIVCSTDLLDVQQRKTSKFSIIGSLCGESTADQGISLTNDLPDIKTHGVNMGPTWVLSAPDGPHVVPMNLAIRAVMWRVFPFHHRICTGHHDNIKFWIILPPSTDPTSRVLSIRVDYPGLVSDDAMLSTTCWPVNHSLFPAQIWIPRWYIDLTM